MGKYIIWVDSNTIKKTEGLDRYTFKSISDIEFIIDAIHGEWELTSKTSLCDGRSLSTKMMKIECDEEFNWDNIEYVVRNNTCYELRTKYEHSLSEAEMNLSDTDILVSNKNILIPSILRIKEYAEKFMTGVINAEFKPTDKIILVDPSTIVDDYKNRTITFLDRQNIPYMITIDTNNNYVLLKSASLCDNILSCDNVIMCVPTDDKPCLDGWYDDVEPLINLNDSGYKVIMDIPRPYTAEKLRNRFLVSSKYKADEYLFNSDGSFNRGNSMGYNCLLKSFFEYLYDKDIMNFVVEVPQHEDFIDEFFISNINNCGDEWFHTISYGGDLYLMKWYQIGRTHVEEIYKNGRLIEEHEYVDLCNRVLASLIKYMEHDDRKQVKETKIMEMIEKYSYYKLNSDLE